jgi:hypothetical protein
MPFSTTDQFVDRKKRQPLFQPYGHRFIVKMNQVAAAAQNAASSAKALFEHSRPANFL